MTLTDRATARKESAAKEMILLFLMASLILLGTHYSVFSVAAFAVGCCIIISGNQIRSLEMMIFLAPMATIFKASSTSLAFLTYLELFFVLFYLVQQRGKIERIEIGMILFGFYLVVIELLNGGIDFNATIKMVVNLFMLSIATKANVEGETKRLFVLFILGVIVSSLIANISSSFFDIAQYVGMKGYGVGSGGYVIRFSGLYKDPNYYSVNVIIALCEIILLFKRRKISSIIAIGFAILLTAFAVETVSKSAILMLAIPVIMFLYATIRERRYGLFALGVVITACILVLAVSNRIPALDNIMGRFLSAGTDLDSLTTHRSTLWVNYFSYLSEHINEIVFGRSLLNYTLNGVAPHNTYIDLIYQLGIVGSIFLLLIVIRIFRNRKMDIKRCLLNYSVLICIVIMYLFLSELQYYDLPFHFIMCYFALNFNTEETEERELTCLN